MVRVFSIIPPNHINYAQLQLQFLQSFHRRHLFIGVWKFSYFSRCYVCSWCTLTPSEFLPYFSFHFNYHYSSQSAAKRVYTWATPPSWTPYSAPGYFLNHASRFQFSQFPNRWQLFSLRSSGNSKQALNADGK